MSWPFCAISMVYRSSKREVRCSKFFISRIGSKDRFEGHSGAGEAFRIVEGDILNHSIGRGFQKENSAYQIGQRWPSSDPDGRDGVAAAGRPRKSHVIPANAGIQEATSLGERHPFGSGDGPTTCAAASWPWIFALAGMTLSFANQHANRRRRACGGPRIASSQGLLATTVGAPSQKCATKSPRRRQACSPTRALARSDEF
jgi:hypothetical protein